MMHLRTTLVHKLSRFLMFAMLFAVLGASVDDVFERGHGGDIQKVAVLVSDEPADSSDLDLFLADASASPAFLRPTAARPPFPAALAVQAFYSPPPRPPAQA